MNWVRFMNRLFGARIQINEPDRVQFETNEPWVGTCTFALVKLSHLSLLYLHGYMHCGPLSISKVQCVDTAIFRSVSDGKNGKCLMIFAHLSPEW